MASNASPVALALLLSTIPLFPATARAAPLGREEEDDDAIAARIDALEIAPPAPRGDPVGHRAPLWIALQATFASLASGRRDVGAMMVLGVPLGRIAEGPSRRAAEPQKLEPPVPSARPSGDAGKPPPLEPKLAPRPVDARPPELAIPATVGGDVARGAIRAALRRARLADPETRLDALVTRAARAALLPELRLRAMRLVDETQSQTPTQYDPQHATASGGSSFWLEARATWHLDRLVFRDEEVSVERMRYERAEAQEKLASRVLELLFAWQKALALAESPVASPEELLAARLKVVETETSLDVLTEGWFARWRARDALRPLGRGER